MSGSCYSCATQFGIFKKEHGCKNCAYSFCKDCVTKRAAVPKHNNEKHKVCNSCFAILTGQATKSYDQARYSPPEALKKRLAALEDKNKEPPGRNRQQNDISYNVQKKYKGMSKEDIAMAERLEKLKEDRRKAAGAIPSQKEIEDRLSGLKDNRPPPPKVDDMTARLAILKGQDPEKSSKPFVYKPDRRFQQEQIDDLLEEICAEVEIDSHDVDPAAEVESKLQNLKDQSGGENNLNKSGVPTDKQYSKNIPFITSQDKSASGEDMSMEDMNRLMKQVADELEMDAQSAIAGLQKDKELMERLEQLKKDRKKNDTEKEVSSDNVTDETGNLATDSVVDSDDEEQAIKKILKQALEESKLDDDLEADGYASNNVKRKSKPSKNEKKVQNTVKPKEDEEESDPDEFPWCCICNEDATIRCIDCDYDLYCKRCFKEGHDKLDMNDHRTLPFKQKIGNS